MSIRSISAGRQESLQPVATTDRFLIALRSVVIARILFRVVRRYRRVCFVTGSAIVALAQLSASSQAVAGPQDSISATYNFVSLDIPAPNGQVRFTNLADIADNGDLLDFLVAAPDTPGFLLQQFRTIPIMCENAEFTSPWGINNRAEISGTCIYRSTSGTSATSQGFLRLQNGDLVFINFPGAISTSAFRLNDNSEVVGYYQSANRTTHGYIWSNGVFKTIDLPHLVQTFPRGINNLGHVVGDYIDSGGRNHGFIHYPDGSFSHIDFPGAQATFPTDINDDGQVVGGYRDAQGLVHGFLLKGGRFFTVIVPFPNSRTNAQGINQKGQIVGEYGESNSTNSQGFVATPE
jgi:probable HAF family extracellular repeat protein